ncbi:ABC transporter permease [Peribacillus loiseleuriae]|uniref:ABC transporter permease n=1 Tax=Peribacillus loiseleuriae TaxID=1679170 RepID=UPI003CFCC147
MLEHREHAVLSKVNKIKESRFTKPKINRKVLLGSILPLTLLIIWEASGRMGIIESHLLPIPSVIVEGLYQMALEGTLWGHIGTTLIRVFAGFLIGTFTAVIIGSLVGYMKIFEELIDPIIQAFRSIPSLAWVPLFILWMGIGESSKVILIAVGVFFPVYLNMVAGIRGVDRKLIEVGKIYGYTSFEIVSKIILPASLPSLLTGIRSGLGLGWMFVVAAEIMGASKGLGYLLIVGQNTYSPDVIIGSIILFAILGKFTDWLLKFIEERSLRWQDSYANQR